jgi:hypothetical protein
MDEIVCVAKHIANKKLKQETNQVMHAAHPAHIKVAAYIHIHTRPQPIRNYY